MDGRDTELGAMLAERRGDASHGPLSESTITHLFTTFHSSLCHSPFLLRKVSNSHSLPSALNPETHRLDLPQSAVGGRFFDDSTEQAGEGQNGSPSVHFQT